MLSKKETLYIKSQLRRNRPDSFSLEEEMIDFVCCEVEFRMDQGDSFDTAVRLTFSELAADKSNNVETISRKADGSSNMRLLRSYFKVAQRNFVRYRANTVMNLAGLVLGLSSVLVIALYVQYELSFDDFHKDANRAYKINTIDSMMDQVYHHGGTSPMLQSAIAEEIPQVEKVVSIRSISARKPLKAGGNLHFSYQFSFVQKEFFDVLSFPLVKGASEGYFDDPYNVLITESFAARVFNEADPLGQLIAVDKGDKTYEFTVVGVMKDLPQNTHLNNNWDAFDLLSSDETYKTMMDYQPEWTVNDMNTLTYVKLKNESDEQRVVAQINELLKRRVTEELNYEHYLQPVTDIHLNTRGTGIESEGNVTQVYTFALIGLLILLIACINYINLATAKITIRTKEVGVRKVLGAGRNQFLTQFIIEAFLLSALAFVSALIVVYVAIPAINSTYGLNLSFSIFDNLGLISGLFVTLILMSIVTGGSPGLYLSRFASADLLKSSFAVGDHKFSVRKILVVFQFGISASIIICTIVIVGQLNFMQDKSLGFDKGGVIYVSVPHTEMGEKGALLKDVFSDLAAVNSVSLTGASLATGRLLANNIQIGASEEGSFQLVLPVDFNYEQTMGLELKEGQWFDKEQATDAGTGLVINESFAKYFSLENPLGQKLSRWGEEGQIIGVVKDFHFKSLHSEIEPLIMHMNSGYSWNYTNMVLKLNSGDISATMALMDEAWDKVFPERPFEWNFLDDQLETNYRKEMVFASIFKSFAFIAIAVSCLGLLGLVSFSVERKSKEIGVRKVLGASVSSILVLVSKEFSKLILIGFAIAVPFAYFFLEEWLQGFKYRIDIGFSAFLLAGLVTLFVAWLATGYTSFRAARANPVESLRSE